MECDVVTRHYRYVPVTSMVFCLTHGEIHEATTDPYDVGADECSVAAHRRLYWLSRKGDGTDGEW